MTIVVVDEDVLEKGGGNNNKEMMTLPIQSSSKFDNNSSSSSDDDINNKKNVPDDVENNNYNKNNNKNDDDDTTNKDKQKQIMDSKKSHLLHREQQQQQQMNPTDNTWSRSNSSSVRFKEDNNIHQSSDDDDEEQPVVVVATSSTSTPGVRQHHHQQQQQQGGDDNTMRRRSSIREWALEQKSKRDGLLDCLGNKDSSTRTSRTDSTAFWLQRSGTSKSNSDQEEEEEEDKEEVDEVEEARVSFREEVDIATAAAMPDTASTAAVKKNNHRDDKSKKQLLKRQSSFSRWAMKSHKKLFGDDYTGREGIFVIVAGALIAFNTGYVNGSCLSGLISPNGEKQSVAGFSGTYTKSGLALADGEFNDFFFHSNMILSYMFGSLISGFLTPNETPYRIEPTYGPTFLIGGIFLLISSILAAIEFEERYVWFFAAAANGIQNGIASIYSKNLIRCSLTGASTDIALVIGQMLRGNRKKLLKGVVLSLIVVSFWLGGIISLYATTYFRTYSLFVNATLFWLIGFALIYFLVSELQITVRAAVMGSWDWKVAIKQLSKQMIRESMMQNGQEGQLQQQQQQQQQDSDDFDLISLNSMDYDELFDRIDVDGDGHLEEHEMLDALTNAGMDISLSRIKSLIKAADTDNDGTIDRQEWKMVCKSL